MRPARLAGDGRLGASSASSSALAGSWPRCAADQLDQRLADQARLAGARRRRSPRSARRAESARRAPCRLLRVMPRSSSQPLRRRAASRARGVGAGEQVARGVRGLDLRAGPPAGRCRGPGRRARRRPGRRRRASRRGASCRGRARPRTASCRRACSCVERAQQRLAVGRMQAGRRLVEHVDDAEQVASGSASPGAAAAARRATASACCGRATDSRGRARAASRCARAGRRRCAARRCASPRTGWACGARRARRVRRAAGGDAPRVSRLRAAARLSVGAAARRRRSGPRRPARAPRRRGRAAAATASPMSSPAKRHRQRLALQPLAVAGRADAADHEARDALLHQRALRRREGVQHVACARR